MKIALIKPNDISLKSFKFNEWLSVLLSVISCKALGHNIHKSLCNYLLKCCHSQEVISVNKHEQCLYKNMVYSIQSSNTAFIGTLRNTALMRYVHLKTAARKQLRGLPHICVSTCVFFKLAWLFLVPQSPFRSSLLRSGWTVVNLWYILRSWTVLIFSVYIHFYPEGS